MNFSQRITITSLAVLNLALSVACSRGNTVYSDPEVSGAATPVATPPELLPEDFSNHSVNRASIELEDQGEARALRFQTETGSNPVGNFNGSGLGSSAILGLSHWSGRPVPQAEPMTFDVKNIAGSLKLNLSLQIDLSCDSADVRVVRALGSDIEAQGAVSMADGSSRLTASLDAPIWLSRSLPILDPDSGDLLLPDSGPPVSLQALLAKFPAACLKNASTGALELPLSVPTSSVLWSLGDESNVTFNVLRVRRLSVGNETFEIFQ